MSIAKIFHVYFGFIMLISTFALASYHSDVWKYFENSYVSVMNVVELKPQVSNARVEFGDFEVSLQPNLERSFVYSGEEYSEGLGVTIKGNGNLEGIKFGLSGDNVVEDAELIFGKRRFEGKSDGNGFVFNHLKMDLAEGVEGKLIFKIKDDAEIGDRFGVVLGKEALKVIVGFQSHFFPGTEDSEKVYFSVVGKK